MGRGRAREGRTRSSADARLADVTALRRPGVLRGKGVGQRFHLHDLSPNGLEVRLHGVTECGKPYPRFAFKRRPPSSPSKVRIAFESEGCETPLTLAARVKCSTSQSARKYRTWIISMSANPKSYRIGVTFAGAIFGNGGGAGCSGVGARGTAMTYRASHNTAMTMLPAPTLPSSLAGLQASCPMIGLLSKRFAGFTPDRSAALDRSPSNKMRSGPVAGFDRIATYSPTHARLAASRDNGNCVGVPMQTF